MSRSQPVGVIVADDDALLREVLSEVLEDDGRFDFLGAAEDAPSAIDLVREHEPAVALVDVKMPGGGGPHVAAELRAMGYATRVVALSSRDDRSAIVDMFRAGAVSYLVKGAATTSDIATTLLRIANGEVVLPPTVGSHLLDELGGHLERAHLEERERQLALHRIRGVLDDPDSLTMRFQPIVELASGAIAGAEALARFSSDPPRSPDRWFADAGAVGLQLELELQAIRAAMGAFDQLPDGAYLSVNASPETAMDPGLQALILSCDASRLVIEITEHAPVTDYDAFQRAVEPLRAAGVRLAVDDAGAGFATLGHILALGPDLIKLDLSLTRGVDTDRSRRALARALIAFAGEIGATLVAEGVETVAERDALRELGVTHGQGYLLGRPGPLDAFRSSVTSGS